jgi:putative transcription factor
MDCEICGEPVSRVRQTVVDGNILIVCDKCASFGKEKPAETGGKAAGQLHGVEIPRRLAQQEFDLGLEIVPDFGKIVLQARQAKGLTTKELAMKIFEKESLVHRIEHQGIKPSDSLIKKLEKELGIILKKKEE